jgi:tRNA(Ile)-lysidine synthase
MTLLDCVRRTIRRHRLADAGSTMVVALSGGSDSVALACVLRELSARGELRVAGLAHFNHQLRDAAAADERFCRELAERLGWKILVGCEDVRARAIRERRSLEDAARRSRYAFLEEARRHFAADLVAVGHTRDDQAETFLLRTLRGAGARGLAGIHPRRGTIVRPLLDCRRDDLRAYLAAARVPFVSDETNDDVTIPRNRVRAELLPMLQARFNPSIVDVLGDAAEVARQEWEWMASEADVLSARIGRARSDGWTFDADALSRAPVALARLVLQTAVTASVKTGPLSFQHLDRAMAVARGELASVDLPGLRVQRDGADLVLIVRTGRGEAGTNLFRYPLSIPGEVVIAEAACVVSAEVTTAENGRAVLRTLASRATGRDVALVGLRPVGSALSVRNRRQGDRFRPPGLAGTKKLQDFFVDRKVARSRRDLVPLVVDQADRIVWVAGHAINDEFGVTDPAQAVLILRLMGLGGSA